MCDKSSKCKHHHFNLPGKKVLSIVLVTLAIYSLSFATCPRSLKEEFYHIPQHFSGFSTLEGIYNQFSLSDR